ncbi:hypothetical protein ACFOYW_14190 [Gryllotalpicola reticulitermitis]|uniref:Uncharacterized protein n=1 Tax=Gryllotalpicola reticulitermitis TaxID=1184153 RepID=A0ABV8QB13_9MICO
MGTAREVEIYRRVLSRLAQQDYARGADLQTGILTVAPRSRHLDDGSQMPARLDIQIDRFEFGRAYPTLVHGGRQLWTTGTDEDHVFNLLDVHLRESIDSMNAPGNRGFRYEDGKFVPWSQ